MGILYYGPDLSGSSHLWMRRQYDFFESYIDILVEHQKPFFEISNRIELLLLPQRTKYSSSFVQFVADIHNDIQRRKMLFKSISNHGLEFAVVHFLTNAVPYKKVWKSFGKPVFVHCHGIDVTWEKTGSTRTWRKLWWGDYIKEVRKLSQNVSFVANSDRTKNQLLKIGIHEKRIYVNNIGVPVSNNIPDRSKRKNFLKILFIGRLVDVKGPTLTIKAFEEACEIGLDGELIIAGDGPLYSECKRLIEKSKFNDKIRLIGVVSAEKGEELRMEADVFSAHSRKGPDTLQEEAYGVAFIEAMIAGLPVITGKSGTLPEIIRDGIDGFLFQPGDVKKQAHYFIECWKNPQKRILMGKSARKRAKANYSIQQEIEGLRKIYGVTED